MIGSQKINYTVYNYNESGNRVSKNIWKYNGTASQPTYPTGSWTFEMTEFYVRNLSGAEVAVYGGNQAVKFWNIWGSDNAGRIESSGDKKFYIKDHLGSVRCVIDASSTILSSQDFDVWGHKINGRSYISDKPSKYQFTSKERDLESDYDYFGARYYDSRIGRWGGVDPSQNKLPGWSPYRAFFDNPLNVSDANGETEYPEEFKVQYEKDYPNFTSFLKTGFEKILDDEQILEAFTVATGLDADVIRADFKWNESPTIGGPIIYIEDLSKFDHDGNMRGGYFDPKDPNVIHLDKRWVLEYENAKNDEYKDALLLFLTAITGHEYSHLGFYKKDKTKNELKDMGTFWEEMAFGKSIKEPSDASDIIYMDYDRLSNIISLKGKSYKVNEIEIK